MTVRTKFYWGGHTGLPNWAAYLWGWGRGGFRGGEIECIVGSRDQRCFQGWPLDSPHVCHGIRHAGCPTLHSLASLLFSEFKPKVHGEGVMGGEGRAEAKRWQRADLEQFSSQEGAS